MIWAIKSWWFNLMTWGRERVGCGVCAWGGVGVGHGPSLRPAMSYPSDAFSCRPLQDLLTELLTCRRRAQDAPRVVRAAQELLVRALWNSSLTDRLGDTSPLIPTFIITRNRHLCVSPLYPCLISAHFQSYLLSCHILYPQPKFIFLPMSA